MIKCSLVGNPNTGKTTLFNSLTGAHEHVGNWHGVTVEEKAVTYLFAGQEINIVDLPGIYSLTPLSFEEKTKIWSVLSLPYQLGVYFSVAPVLLSSRRIRSFKRVVAADFDITQERAADGRRG